MACGLLNLGVVTGQNLADASRLGSARLSAREAEMVRACAPSVGPAMSGSGSGAGACVDLNTEPAALHAVLRSVGDEETRRKVLTCPMSGAVACLQQCHVCMAPMLPHPHVRRQ